MRNAIQQYNERCNQLKIKVRDGTIAVPFLMSEVERIVNDYFERCGQLPPAETYKASNKPVSKFKQVKKGITSIEQLNDLIIYQAEREEKEQLKKQAKTRTNKEWFLLEKKMKNRKYSSLEQLTTEIIQFIDIGLITEAKAKRIIKGFKECKSYQCNNVFYARGVDKRIKYCSKKCNITQKKAEQRKKTTNTYLQQNEYLPRTEEAREKEWKRKMSTRQKENKSRVEELEELNKKAPIHSYYLSDV